MLVLPHKTAVDPLPFGLKPKAKAKPNKKDALDALEQIDGKEKKENN